MKKRLCQPHNIILLLATIAVVNAIYLTSIAYSGGGFCDINATMSCGTVFSYSRSWIGSIPFPLAAVVVYPLIWFMAWKGRTYDENSIKWRKFAFLVSGLGIMFNSYFLYHEIMTWVYCPLCLICLGIIVTIFVMSWRQLRALKS
jgi:uncharacterized membrane protein